MVSSGGHWLYPKKLTTFMFLLLNFKRTKFVFLILTSKLITFVFLIGEGRVVSDKWCFSFLPRVAAPIDVAVVLSMKKKAGYVILYRSDAVC